MNLDWRVGEEGWQLATTEPQTRCQSAVLCVRLLHPIQPILFWINKKHISVVAFPLQCIAPIKSNLFVPTRTLISLDQKAQLSYFAIWKTKATRKFNVLFEFVYIFWPPLFLMHILRSSILSYKSAS